MHHKRAAIFLTIGVALAFTPSIRRWASDLGHEERSRPTKANVRESGRTELSALKELAEAMAANDAAQRSAEELAMACSRLNADELIEFLGDQRLWPRKPSSSPVVTDDAELRARLLHLAPLRTAALERLAPLDLRRGMLSFPADAAVLLEAAANADGAETFRIWKEVKEEWALAESVQGRDFFRHNVYIEGLGILPSFESDRLTAEQEALAALGKGWAANDPDDAWAAVESGAFDYLCPTALASMIDGLGEKSDWRTWSKRIGSLHWPMPSEENPPTTTDPETDSALKLGQRWIKSAPNEALEWYAAQRSRWESPKGHVIFLTYESGTTGRAEWKSIPCEAYLYATWLGTNTEVCLERLKKDAISDDILADIVRWTKLPGDKKLRVIDLVKNPLMQSELAKAVARSSKAWVD